MLFEGCFECCFEGCFEVVLSSFVFRGCLKDVLRLYGMLL